MLILETHEDVKRLTEIIFYLTDKNISQMNTEQALKIIFDLLVELKQSREKLDEIKWSKVNKKGETIEVCK